MAPLGTVAPPREATVPAPRAAVDFDRPTIASPDLAGQLQAALDAARSVSGADGVTFAIASGGRLRWAGASGHAAGDGPPLSPATPGVIGSVTKTFVAATVLQLVADGRLSLDDSVGELLPPYPRVDRSITVRQLLDHTSGLADLFNPRTRVGLEAEPPQAWEPREVLATIDEPVAAPGERWWYSNTNYFLLGLIVERVTGSSLADELTRRYLGPLELAETRVLSPVDPTPLSAAWVTIFWGSGTMTASAGNLARWGDALYAGSALDDTGRASMLAFNTDDYGLGAQRIELGGEVGWGHTGLIDRYTTLLVHLPGSGVTVALEANLGRVDLEAMLLATPPDGGPSLLELATGG